MNMYSFSNIVTGGLIESVIALDNQAFLGKVERKYCL